MRNVFAKAILAAAEADSKVLLLTGDHGYALFDEFRKCRPAQFINAGIAEQNMVGVAAGLTKAGFKPIVYGLSAFVPIRVLEQIKIDVCYENLPVVFIGDGAGLVYSSLGSSHQSTEDIAVLRALPNINILSPCDIHEMYYVMSQALRFESPQYVRMGKSDTGQIHSTAVSPKLGDLIQVRTGTHNAITFLATGSMVKTAIALADSTDSNAWSVPSIKPINKVQLQQIALNTNTIVVLEEHAVAGGLGSLVAEIICEQGTAKVIRIGIQERFSQKCGSYEYLLKEHGIDLSSLLPRINILQQSLTTP
ncbi:MAG: transketolase C-terminal domain-containing protein [Cellvibrio sp.]|uniref:transketolase family protein n=1 Tax=Cellvibrio sp. TaxID=1965322 RepID=UPI002720DA06|nr:transketolase C-terminal domain-containing protein [Cellvibrio sp.]